MTRLQDRLKYMPEKPWQELDDITINSIAYLVEISNGSHFYGLEKQVLLWAHYRGASLDVNSIKNLLRILDVEGTAVEVLIETCAKINDGVKVRAPKWADEFTSKTENHILTMRTREVLDNTEQA